MNLRMKNAKKLFLLTTVRCNLFHIQYFFQGHRIPVLPKALSQMKTTETRSYLSRLIWATNDWKRPQYGNPDTKPIWWPNELLNWSEMKKMGGKKSAGLTNVNYNEIQKNILYEVIENHL